MPQTQFQYQTPDGTMYLIDHAAKTISIQNADGSWRSTGGDYATFCTGILWQLKSAWAIELVKANTIGEIQDFNGNNDDVMSAMTMPVVNINC